MATARDRHPHYALHCTPCVTLAAAAAVPTAMSVSAEGPPSHPLACPFSFWYLDKQSLLLGGSGESYEDSLKLLCTFDSCESFWACYSHIHRPESLPLSLTLHLFRHPIKPVWEDEANQRGGKCSMRMRKGVACRVWEELVLALLGDAWGLGEEVCGLVLTLKANEDVVAVWNRTANDRDAVLRIKQVMMRTLGVDRLDAFDYRPHDVSLKGLHSINTTFTR